MQSFHNTLGRMRHVFHLEILPAIIVQVPAAAGTLLWPPVQQMSAVTKLQMDNGIVMRCILKQTLMVQMVSPRCGSMESGRVGVTNANFGGRGWDDIVIGSNGFEAINGRCMAVDYDDIAISNTGPIGPIGGGNQNTGEDASSSSGSGCGFVKDINGKGQGAKGEGLSFAMMIIISLMVIPIIRRIARISDTK